MHQIERERDRGGGGNWEGDRGGKEQRRRRGGTEMGEMRYGYEI